MKETWVIVTTDCVEHPGFRTVDGYALQRFHGKQMGAHRAAYLREVGPIPEGLEIDHLCGNRACVNTDHLEAVTRTENIRRSQRHVPQARCKRGHEYTPENTYTWRGRQRHCKACRRETHHERKVRA